MPKQRRSESGKEAAKAVEWTAQRGLKRKWKTRVSRKKQLQRLKPAEDERKLQTNDITVSTEKSGPFLLQKKLVYLCHTFSDILNIKIFLHHTYSQGIFQTLKSIKIIKE